MLNAAQAREIQDKFSIKNRIMADAEEAILATIKLSNSRGIKLHYERKELYDPEMLGNRYELLDGAKCAFRELTALGYKVSVSPLYGISETINVLVGWKQE